MHVAALRLDLRLPDCEAARLRRRRMRSILAKLRRHFNVSLAETDSHDGPDRVVLGVSAIALTRREARAILERVAEAVGAHPAVEVLGLATEEL